MVYGQDPPASQREPEEISEALEIFSILFVRETVVEVFWRTPQPWDFWIEHRSESKNESGCVSNYRTPREKEVVSFSKIFSMFV